MKPYHNHRGDRDAEEEMKSAYAHLMAWLFKTVLFVFIAWLVMFFGGKVIERLFEKHAGHQPVIQSTGAPRGYPQDTQNPDR
jgi:hypothetical protein